MRVVLVSLLINSGVVGLLAVVFILAQPLVARLYAVRRVVIWLLLAVVLLIPVGALLPGAPVKIELATPSVLVDSPLQPANLAGESAKTQDIRPNTIASKGTETPPLAWVGYRVNIFAIGVAVWIAGAVVFLLLEVLRWAVWRRRVWRWKMPLKDEEMLGLVRKVQSRLHYKGKLRVYSTPALSTPVVEGVFRVKLLLPEGLAAGQEAEMMLSHEITHVCRGDIGKKLLLLAAGCVHWFNPFVWLMVHRAGQDIELACDERVVQGQSQGWRLAYSAALLACAKSRPVLMQPLLVSGFKDSKNSLMERFKSMLDTRAKRKGTLLIALGMAGIIAALCLIRVYPAQQKAVWMEETDGQPYLNLVVAGQPDKIMPTPVPAPVYNEYDIESGWQGKKQKYSAANVGSFYSVAVSPGIEQELVQDSFLEFYTTADGGKTWLRTRVDVREHMNDARRLWHGYSNKQVGYVFLEGAKWNLSETGLYLYRTGNGGKTWKVVRFVPSPTQKIAGAGFVKEETGLICYGDAQEVPHVLFTENGGESWEQAQGLQQALESVYGRPSLLNTYTCEAASFVGKAQLVFSCSSGGDKVLLVSSDGRNWSAQPLVDREVVSQKGNG